MSKSLVVTLHIHIFINKIISYKPITTAMDKSISESNNLTKIWVN